MAVLDRRSFVISERTLVPGHFNALLASPTKIDKAWDHTAAVSQTLQEHSTPASHLTEIITRDPNKDLDNNVAHSGRKRTLRSIRTLDLSKLSRHDYLDFSGIGPSCAYVVVPPGARIPDAAVKTSPFTYIRLFPRGWRSHTFPTNAKGFLYYYKPPHSPPMAGQIRFRCMQSDSPQDFASGYDLCGDNGLPWSVPLVLCGHTACYAPILDVALRDGLISHKLVDLMQKTPTPRKLPVADRLVYTLGQPFALRLGAAVGPRISFLGKDRFIADVLTTISGSPSKRLPLYQGTVISCFELSKLPEHVGRRVVVIRIIRLVDSDPIRPNLKTRLHERPESDKLTPRVGGLLMGLRHSKVKPIAFDLDSVTKWGVQPISQGLELLLENEKLYGSEGGSSESRT
ncbi:hypothetical protein BD311DRAFT_674870 [Dichomitus squalens]|uniref:Uncharacterized protein n=1 Tax=Dichomitus squalens TaxID=114155 RepID=A0A4Q9MB76_9APHY|nr:hypothetical protein BD311DRAFT_674870 [Dichomitus squalens]